MKILLLISTKVFIYFFIFIINIIYIGNISAFKVEDKKINFSQSIAYQKKSVKIYGTTISNLKIIINIGKDKYRIKSSKKGIYSLKIHKLSVGKYNVVSKVFVKNKYYQVPRIKEIILSSEYVNKMKSYYIKKIIHPNPPLILKEGVGKVIKKLEKPRTVINFLLLYMLLGIMSLLMLFLVLRKNDFI